MLPPFVTARWLAEHRESVVVALVRRGPQDPEPVPGAVAVEMEGVLSGPSSAETGRHPLPDPAVFAAGLSAAGIGDDSTVVAYDVAGGVFAARLVWMLRAVGVPAALLDGGPPPAAEVGPDAPTVLTPRPWPVDRLADLLNGPDGADVVLDARPRERFLGAPDPLDPRPGHVAGAVPLPARESLDGDGRLLPEEVLAQRFADAGVVPGADVVAYCGSGVTACHTLLVLEQLGLGLGRLYPGSWSQYGALRPEAAG